MRVIDPKRPFMGGSPPHEVASTINTYLKRYEAAEEDRKLVASNVARDYYTLATDFYEFGWGQSFHFAPRTRGETVRESLLRYEHALAARLGLKPGMRVLDIGCGVGGPMRNIARLTGATIQGLTISEYQVKKGTARHQEAGLAQLCQSLEGDFCQMPFPSQHFDAVYEIESCCHAADRRSPFREAFRVLKPGGLFGGYDWCLTSQYDATSPQHQLIRKGIEKGDGLPPLCTMQQHDDALRDSGFELLETADLAPTADPETPWYQPLKAGFSLKQFANSRAGAFSTHTMVRALELLRLAPKGTVATHAMLRIAQNALPAGGELGIFTPNYFFLARKPS